MRPRHIVSMILALFAFGKLFFSYLDPGSGSLIIQLLVGTILSMLFFVRVFWSRIKNMFKRPKDTPDDVLKM